MKKRIEGVYFLIDGTEIVYVGASDYVNKRVKHHARTNKRFTEFIVFEYPNYIFEGGQFFWRHWLEYYFIGLCRPKYNTMKNPDFLELKERIYNEGGLSKREAQLKAHKIWQQRILNY